MTIDDRDWLYGELLKAFLQARKGKRITNDEHDFEVDLFDNVSNLCDSIYRRDYKPGRGIAFIVKKPVIREVFAAPFRDRVVHHFLYNMVYEWWDRHFIEDSYSRRLGKGTLYGIKRAERMVQSVTNNYREEAYVFKFDLKGYFMSLPRKELYEKAIWGLGEQFSKDDRRYKICKFLWREVIFDDPVEGVRRVGDLEAWKDLPKSKSLFGQEEGRGIVIGNLSSQLLSNIYLSDFDRFMKNDLSCKYYGRYVDDFFILVKPCDYEKMKKNVVLMENYLRGMKLELHPKKRYVNSVYKGFEFLGTKIYPGRILPGERLKRNYKQAVRDYRNGEKKWESILSYVGHFKHLDKGNFLEDVFQKEMCDFLMGYAREKANYRKLKV